MYCWGSNKNGQLGLDSVKEDSFAEPKENKTFEKLAIKQIACGYNHTLFLADDGTLMSCGSNDFEQLGHNNSSTTRPEYVKALEIHFVMQVGCGHSYSLAITNQGQLYCWGSICGNRENTDLFFPKPTLLKPVNDAKFVQISCGYNFFLALSEDGKVYVMGVNDHGQLGLGDHNNRTLPIHLVSLQGVPVAQIACGGYHSVVLTVSGSIFTFGKNSFGQLGFGDTQDRIHPTPLKFLATQKACYISCGEDFTTVLTKDGGVFSFGAGMYGQLGHNSFEDEHQPKKIAELMGTEVTQIVCGRCHTLVYVAASNKLYSFGLCDAGQLGFKSKNEEGQLINKCVPANVTGFHFLKTQNSYLVFAGGDKSFLVNKFIPKELDHRQISYENQILTVNTDRLSALITLPSTSQENDKPRVIDKSIQTLFTSASCLNGSFLDPKEHYNTSNKNPGIDIKQARDLFGLILKADSQIVKLIFQKLTELCTGLPDNPPSIEAIRLYITIPHLFPFNMVDEKEKKVDLATTNIEDVKLVYLLLNAYAYSVNRLPEKSAARVLDYWFTWAGVDFYIKLLMVYKYIVRHIIGLPATTEESEIRYRNTLLRSSLTFLRKLHKINLENHEIVPYYTFYIPELIDKVDIRKDYLEWFSRKYLRHPHHVFNMIELGSGDTVFYTDYPFVCDASAKTLLLQADDDLQKHMQQQQAIAQTITSIFIPIIIPANPFLTLQIKREQLVQDTINQITKQKQDDLKKPLVVIFVGEDALDAGGVRKEFFMLLMQDILDPKYGMFNYYDETHTIWFHDQSFEKTEMYNFIGQICGIAIYNQIIIDLPFPLALYKKLLKQKVDLEDIKSLSPTEYNSLKNILEYEGDDFETALCINFQIARKFYGETVVVELIPNGSNIPVTKENKKQFVNLYVDYIFNKSVEQAFEEFSKGFNHVCTSKVLELFQPSELMAMVVGNQNYDFFELEKNAEYKGEYAAEHPVIKNFWSVFHELTLEQKKKFLLFLTGTDRIPIFGMKRIKIVIQSTNGGDSYHPVAHTCFNLLDLPKYSKRELLKDKLLHAIEHSQGFSLV